jgi:hypothetical protein
MNFEEFEKTGVYSEKFAKYVDNYFKSRELFNDYSKTISKLIISEKTYENIQRELEIMKIQAPTIPKNIEDVEIDSHETIVQTIEAYKTTIEAKDKLKNDLNKKFELASKVREVFNLKWDIIKNEENMNDAQKIIYNLEKEVSEKRAEVVDLEKKCNELRSLIINNERKFYEYTIDNMKLFTSFLKIKEGTAYSENKLVEAVNKMITTPIDVLFKENNLKVDATEIGYSTENYAEYNDEPVNTDNIKSVEDIRPFNNSSRTFLLKTHDVRDIGKLFDDMIEKRIPSISLMPDVEVLYKRMAQERSK